MSNRPPKGNQTDTINRSSPFVQQTLDLSRQDAFVTSYGVDFIHYKASPSPIGLKDRGDYRREDGVDTITSNGMIYRIAGKFTGTISDNSRNQKQTDAGGIADPSQMRIILPRFYNKNDVSDGDRIYMAPGDRIYISDPNADVFVSNYQMMDFDPEADGIPMFPIVKMEQNILDSQNIEYKQGVDYSITPSGNIRWIPGGNSPGIDPDTGKGRVYSVRYLYRAYWYVLSIPKEVRVTNSTVNGQRTPERMPYHIVAVREYVYHNQNKGESKNQLKSKTPDRAVPAPADNPSKFAISVDMSNFNDDGQQS